MPAVNERNATHGGRVLLVDDDPGIRDVVGFLFEQEGFDVDRVASGEQALEALSDNGYDVVLLDLMLPGLSGAEVCRQLRATADPVPIVMLTAKDAELDRVLGLELGADDYVTKPFSGRELLSRVRAILRRRELDLASPTTDTRVGAIQFDFERYEVKLEGRTIRLTPSEFRLLSLLAEQPGHPYTRREIMQHLWRSEHVGDEHACDVHISNLRSKIELDPANPERLVTVRGFGYRLLV
jgi:two-component system, OmpR family, response regulator RegX3